MPLPAGDLAGDLETRARRRRGGARRGARRVDASGLDVEPPLIEAAAGEALVAAAEGRRPPGRRLPRPQRDRRRAARLGQPPRREHAPCEVVIIRLEAHDRPANRGGRTPSPREHSGMKLVLALTAGACAGVARARRAGRAGRTPPRSGSCRTDGSSPSTAVRRRSQATFRALLAGPTAAERARGLRSAVPRGTPLRGVDDRAPHRHRRPRRPLRRRPLRGSLRARVAQLVRTVSSVPGVAGVRVLVEGGVPLGLFPGLDLRRPVRPGRGPLDETGSAIREAQELLAELGYLAPGARQRLGSTTRQPSPCSSSRSGPACRATVCWARRRSAALERCDAAAARHARRPAATSRSCSTASSRSSSTTAGSCAPCTSRRGAGGARRSARSTCYRKERLSWSVPFEVWMPWASYFTGGIALHEYPIVPTYPASHGCVRVNRYDAPFLYEFATARHARSSSSRARDDDAAAPIAAVAVAALPRSLAATGRRGRRPATKRPGELTVALSLPRPALAGRRGARERGRAGPRASRSMSRARSPGGSACGFGSSRSATRGGCSARARGLGRRARPARRDTGARAGRPRSRAPYLRDDPVVLLRRGLTRPTSLAQLRPLKLCAERGRRAADALAARVRPADASAPRDRRVDALLRRVQTGACDAAVAELSRLGPALEGRRDLFGGLAGRIETERAYAVALERGSPLLPAVDGAARARCAPTGRCAG